MNTSKIHVLILHQNAMHVMCDLDSLGWLKKQLLQNVFVPISTNYCRFPQNTPAMTLKYNFGRCILVKMGLNK